MVQNLRHFTEGVDLAYWWRVCDQWATLLVVQMYGYLRNVYKYIFFPGIFEILKTVFGLRDNLIFIFNSFI